MSIKKSNLAAGFTIVELMIATLVFSVILVVVTYGVLRFTNAYYKGINSSTTQDTARNILDTVSQAIQFSGSTISPGGTNAGVSYFCAGGDVFIYRQGIKYDSSTSISASNPGLYMVTSPSALGCSVVGASYTAGKQLLGTNMRVSALSIAPSASGPLLWDVQLRLAYGDNDLLVNPANGADLTGSAPNVQCGLRTGSQFCSVSVLTTTVQQRVVK